MFFPCPHLTIDAIDEVVIKKMAQKNRNILIFDNFSMDVHGKKKKALGLWFYQVLCLNHALKTFKFQHKTVYHLYNKKYIYIHKLLYINILHSSWLDLAVEASLQRLKSPCCFFSLSCNENMSEFQIARPKSEGFWGHIPLGTSKSILGSGIR